MIPNVDVDLSERRSALNAGLESKEFWRGVRVAARLTYLCEKTIQGKVHEIKEFSIATEVYGKDQNFGEKRDSLVRVEVSRLRRRLLRYYESEGLADSVRILIKPGTYRPDFERSSNPVDRQIVQTPALPPPRRVPQRAIYAVLGAIALIGVWLIVARFTTRAASPKQPQVELPAVPPRVADASQAVRILAGSSVERSIDRFGVEWGGDRYFIGGEQNKWSFGGKEMTVAHPIIRGAPDQVQFKTFRFGSFSYRIPLSKGKYELRLYFSEVVLRPSDLGDGVENRRISDVLMNGQPLLSSLDVAADAGVDTAYIRAFTNVAPVDGFLTLEFRSLRDGAWLNAIEIIPNNTGHPLPVRIVTRNANTIDHNGQLWGIDRYFLGGKQHSDDELVTGTEDPELFRWQRYGNFSYRFPVPPGKYKLRLLFAETYFGPNSRGNGGIGSRVFNVYSSGTTLLRDFDVFKAAGGPNRAIERVFHGLTPNAQGRIEVIFEPVIQYAFVEAIELTSEDLP